MKLNVQSGFLFPTIFQYYRYLYIYRERERRDTDSCIYMGHYWRVDLTHMHQSMPAFVGSRASLRRKSIACIASSKTAAGEDKAARIGESWGVRM